MKPLSAREQRRAERAEPRSNRSELAAKRQASGTRRAATTRQTSFGENSLAAALNEIVVGCGISSTGMGCGLVCLPLID